MAVFTSISRFWVVQVMIGKGCSSSNSNDISDGGRFTLGTASIGRTGNFSSSARFGNVLSPWFNPGFLMFKARE